MPDNITVTEHKQSKFTPCPGGVHAAVCVDAVDLGTIVHRYADEEPVEQAKLALVYQVDEINPDTNKRFEPSAEFTASMNDKANLRKWLESWRGKSYTDAEAGSGVPIHKLVGQAGLVTIEQVATRKGRTYAKLKAITPLMKGMTPMVPAEYVRSKHWEEKKAEYARELADYRAKKATEAQSFADFPAALEDDGKDDGLPF